MDINELHKKINEKRQEQGLPKISTSRFIKAISKMHVNGKVVTKYGEVKPTGDGNDGKTEKSL